MVMDRRRRPTAGKGESKSGAHSAWGFCRGHDCVIDVGVSSRKLKLRRINSENLMSMRLKLRSNYG